MNENTIDNNAAVNTEMTAGEMLRNARTTGRRKREIQTIAKQLCIREEFLQALEDCNYTFLPETVYILGFARNYAIELGLNPDDIVSKIKHEMGLVPECATADSEPREEGAGCVIAAQKKTKAAKDCAISAYYYVRRKWKWFLGGMIATVFVCGILIAVFAGHDANDAAAVSGATNSVANSATVAAEPGYKQTVRERFGTENRGKSNIILQANQESWVKIEDGRGNTVFSRVLVPGDVYYMPAGDKYKGTFGNAGGIDVWVDGKLAPKIGPEHTRKNSVPMNADSLMSGTAQ